MLGYGYFVQLGGTQLREVAGRPAVPTIREVILLLCHSNSGGFGRCQLSMVAVWQSAPTIANHILMYESRDFRQLRAAECRAIASRQSVLTVRNILLVLSRSHLVFVGRRQGSAVTGVPAILTVEQVLLSIGRLRLDESRLTYQKRDQQQADYPKPSIHSLAPFMPGKLKPPLCALSVSFTRVRKSCSTLLNEQ
jgi:hypothetical protein